MQAIILASGDELALGQNVDTNSAWLSARLAEFGILTRRHVTVGDELGDLVAVLREACAAAELVILTGGMGPTADDLTREALARVLDAPLEEHAPSLARIQDYFIRMGRPMPAANRVQALCPRGAVMLDNDWGTAPGLRARVGRAEFFAFAGVPREMRGLFEHYVAPFVRAAAGRVILTAAVRTVGMGEALVGERLGALMRRDRMPVVGTNASGGVVTVRIRSEAADEATARAALDETVRAVEARLGDCVFGQGAISLAGAVLKDLRARGATLAVAESCTGGLVAKWLTDEPGASAVFKGGWIVYANELKSSALGVPEDLLIREGAVSEAVARALAAGARARASADYALALTGIAGPDGGTPEKPVGTVWIALATPDGHVAANLCHFAGGREIVRERAANAALNLLRLALTPAPAASAPARTSP